MMKAVSLFGPYTYFLLAEMSRNLEGSHVVFLRQLIGQTAKRHRDRTWRSSAALKLINESGKNTLGTYNYKRQVTVSEWVVLKKILEFYGREKGYEG